MTRLPEAVRCPDCGTDLVSEPGIPGLCPQCLLSLALKDSPAASPGADVASETEDSAPQTLAPLDRLAAGRILGERYQVRELLGRGGMGEVFRAFDLKLRVDVALKAVRPEKLESDRARELLRREVRSAREVVSPNVCRIFDLVAEDGQELVSMEFIDGETLSETLRQRGPLALREAREIAAQFLAGLEAIHQAGLVHRDFKPENVMLTRAGRVVVMDFGLAKASTTGRTGAISGTPAYMAPEQARGDPVDARADVFAAAVVLAEMLSVGSRSGNGSSRPGAPGVGPPGDAPAGAIDGRSGAAPWREARQALWRAVRETPPRVPDGPWAGVLRQALAPNPNERHASARALSRALDEVTERLPGFETRRPYPGLASFTEEDSAYFFGRELEVEALLRKLRRPRLLALVAPSGAGKSSFLRAGLLPALPRGWKPLLTTPGSRPFQALARALAPAFAGDAQAVESLLRFEEPDTAVSLMQRLRQRHEHALVVLDQFEELFTLCPPDVQQAFAQLLGRLVLDADLHVLVSLRDDFLFRCKDHEALAPVFSDLTPLGRLSESALRRALVQPALSCGYRFEDEALVDEMLAQVQKEQGALPLLAFAASRLWDERDRDKGLLTREAYGRIGGVAGALAQHAEATLDRIGAQRIPIVRELFRNLVTAQGTRAVREREELLSLFDGTAPKPARQEAASGANSVRTEPSAGGVDLSDGGRDEAEAVLNALVDARLLTSYERIGEAGDSRHQIEIIHESLLQAWPRLVRWQTQDADGAQLRDQLRQAAQLWLDRGKTDDLLWSGTAYGDFALWRERYPVPLTTGEDAFATAVERNASRRRRHRRAAVAMLVGLAAAVAAVTSVLWQRSEASRRHAEAQTREREAGELLALGRLMLEDHPTGALAHAIASLERADNEPARRFALQALWKGPPISVVHDEVTPTGVRWSDDGRWLGLGGTVGVALLDRDSGARHQLATAAAHTVGFSRDGTRVVTRQADTLDLWSLPDARPLGQWTVPPGSVTALSDRRLLILEFDRTPPLDSRQIVVRERSIDGGPDRVLGVWRPQAAWSAFGFDPEGRRLLSAENHQLLERSLSDLSAPARTLGRHEGMANLWGRQWPGRVVTSDEAGEVRIWDAATGRVDRILRSPASARLVALDPAGRLLATAPGGALPASSLALFDLRAPRVAEPAPLIQKEMDWLNTMAFHPEGRWLTSGQSGRAIFWNVAVRRSTVIRGQKGFGIGLAFTRDGRLVSTSDEGVVRLWDLSAGTKGGVRELLVRKGALLGFIPVVSDRLVAVTNRFQGELLTAPFDGAPARVYTFTRGKGRPVVLPNAVDAQGQRVAVTYLEFGNPEAGSIRIIDLATGAERVLRPAGEPDGACAKSLAALGPEATAHWLPDGRFVSEGATGLRLWDLAAGTSRQLRPCRTELEIRDSTQVRSTPDSRTVVTLVTPGTGSGQASILSAYDLVAGTSRDITSHGGKLLAFTLDPSGAVLITSDADGLVRVGPLTGETPHLLYGHGRAVTSVAVSPDGKWIASGSDDETIRLWPMPERRPLHTLPYEELLEKLRSLTNLRVVADAGSATGYRIEPEPFRGWANAPVW